MEKNIGKKKTQKGKYSLHIKHALYGPLYIIHLSYWNGQSHSRASWRMYDNISAIDFSRGSCLAFNLGSFTTKLCNVVASLFLSDLFQLTNMFY